MCVYMHMLCVCVCVHVHASVHICTCACRGLRLTLDVSVDHSSPYIWGEVEQPPGADMTNCFLPDLILFLKIHPPEMGKNGSVHKISCCKSERTKFQTPSTYVKARHDHVGLQSHHLETGGWAAGAHYMDSLGETVSLHSVRDPTSKYKTESNKGEHLMSSSDLPWPPPHTLHENIK